MNSTVLVSGAEMMDGFSWIIFGILIAIVIGIIFYMDMWKYRKTEDYYGNIWYKGKKEER